LGGVIHLYEIQQQLQQQIELVQTFPQEHSSSGWISSLLQLNPNSLISSSDSMNTNSSDIAIVIWTQTPKSSPLYEPVQRITVGEAGRGIRKLILLGQKKEGEAEFASCTLKDSSIIIWRRKEGGGGGGEGEGVFKVKQRITNVQGVEALLYISHTNEFIFGSNSSLLQIWSRSSSKYKERQNIEISSTIFAFCQANETKNDSKRIEFASGHSNGQIMIWSKQIDESNYSLCKSLKPSNNGEVWDLIFIINDNGFNFFISCSRYRNKIVLCKNKGDQDKEDLEHREVTSLIPMSKGLFASGGGRSNRCLNIWSPSSSSSSS
jgi:hypothetical protein